MAGLVEYSLINGVDNDLVNSIVEVGGDVSSAVGIVDLAEVIRTQLVAKSSVDGKIECDDWLFGSPETNNVWEEPTKSVNAVQANTIADSIKQLYDLMINTNRYLVHVVDKLPTSEISLSAVYLLKHIIPEKSIIKTNIDTSNLITFPGHVGNVQLISSPSYCDESVSNSIIEVKPDENGNIDALFGFNGLVYDVDKYDSLVIKTNILTWGESGVSFSLNGKDFYEIKSDRIVLSKEILNKFGIKTLNNIVFKVTSVNEFDNVTKIKIRGIYLEKQLDYVTKYSAHYFVKEGNSLRRIDTDKFDIDLNSLFYISREEFLSYKADSNKYYNTLETMIKDQLGSFIDSGVTLQETINNIQEQYDSLSKDYNEFIKWTDIADATAETSGLMSASDKRKLDSIESMSLESLDEILTL